MDAWASFPSINRGKTLGESLCFFLKTPYFQSFALLVGSDVFFLLYSVEEEEEEDGDGCCAPDVREFIHHGKSVFMTRPDCKGDR